MYNLAIKKCTSPPLLAPKVENFQIKIYYPAGDRTPVLLNQRQTCSYLSQSGIRKLVLRHDKCLNYGVNMLKNSSTLAVSVPINLSIKLGFVSVNGPRETYFVDSPRIF